MNFEETLRLYEADGWLISQDHPTLPLTIWNYSLSTTYEQHWDEVTIACRGLVTDNTTGYVVSRGFDKFFNLEEDKHTPTEDYTVYEKLDGSYISSFYYNDTLIITSRGSFISDQAMKAYELIERYDKDKLDKNFTYMWEIIYPENRIVVLYEEERLVMLGKRNFTTGEYKEIQHYREFGFDVVKEYPNLKLEELKDLEWDNSEGFVVRFSNGDFIKVKFEEYFRLHKIMTEISTLGVWDILRNGDDMTKILEDVPDEFYDKIRSYEEELKMKYLETKEFYLSLFAEAKKRDIVEDRKLFAEYAINSTNKPAILFKMLDGKSYKQLIWALIRPEFRKL